MTAPGEERRTTPGGSGVSSAPELAVVAASDSKDPNATPTRSKSDALTPVTYEEFLHGSYAKALKRVKLTKEGLSAIASGPKPDESRYANLLKVAASDRKMEKTRNLLLLTMEQFKGHPAAGIVMTFIRNVLLDHPAFRHQGLVGVLENLPEAASEEAALSTLSGQSYSALRWGDDPLGLKRNEAEQCRRNALYCMLLWFYANRGMTAERLQAHLLTLIWEQEGRRKKNGFDRVRALIQAKDRSALGIACSSLEKRALDSKRESVEARGELARAEDRLQKARQKISELGEQIEARTIELEKLKEEFDKARCDHGDQAAHFRDEYEELRGRVLRRLKQEVSLLDDGLHALNQSSPKVHVMVDHAERAIHGLKAEIDRIKGDE
jgi:hypothetical protein